MSIFNAQENQPQENQFAVEQYQLEERCKSGAHWFYWIAALSLVTSIISLAGGSWGFFISLGVTQIFDGFANAWAAEGGSGAVKVIAFVLDFVAIGAFALAGYFASKRHAWVFVVGMIAYALDGLIFILAQHWFGLAFHAYALYSIYGGYKACTRLNELARESAVGRADAFPAETSR